ncbi:putative ribonuclease H-like domain-containing protein [Tanacetum coccineum]
MTGNKSYLSDYEEIIGGFVAFVEDPKGGRITGKGKISTGKLDFEDVYFVKELNRTKPPLIEAARTMLADSKLPTTFWAEAVNTACYVQNRVLVIKPHNKTPYELFLGRKPALSFMRPFGCPVTILNTIDHLDAPINSMNYKPVVAGNQSNGNAGTKAYDDAGKARMETVPSKDYILLPMWHADPLFSQNSKDSPDARFKPSGEEEKIDVEDPGNESGNLTEWKDSEVPKVNAVDPKTSIELLNDLNMPKLEDIVYSDDDEDVGAEADMNKDHPVDQIIGDLNSAPQTRRMTKNLKEHGLIEAIGLFLAYASFKDSVVYQMDVNSAFLYGKIKEEVYVCQQPGFEDPDFPDRVYKVENALYGLHQAPRAWYETLSTYLMENRFQRGQIDKTLFIKRNQGLQVKQKEDGIFTSQDKYVTKILKKFGFSDVKTANTPMETHKPLLKDADGKDVDEHIFQVNPKASHLHDVKRIFRYLKGQPKLGLWYLKDSPFDLVAYTDSDYAGASLDRKSTIGGIGVNAGDSKLMLLGINLLLLEKVNAAMHNLLLLVATVKVKTVNGEVQLQALVDGKKVIITETSVRRDLQLEDAKGIKCLSNADIFEQLALIGYEKPSQKLTFYKAFFSPQWKFFIHTILQCLSAKSTAWNEFSSTMASAIICLATNQKFNFSKYIFESMVKNVDSSVKFLMYPRVGKGFSGAVTPLFPTMMVQDHGRIGEKLRVKRLEKKEGSRTHKLKRLFKVGRSTQVVSSEDEGLGDQEDASKQGRKIDDIDQDAEVTLVDETQGRYDDAQMFDTDVFNGEEVFVAKQSEKVVEEVVSIAEVVVQDPVQSTTITAPSTIPKAKSITFRDPGESTTRTTLSPILQTSRKRQTMVEGIGYWLKVWQAREQADFDRRSEGKIV